MTMKQLSVFFKNILITNKILKNFSVLSLSNALTQFLLIFTSIKIARSLDPLLFGTYNLIILHVSICGVIASVRLRNIIIRTIARDKTIVKNIFAISLTLRLIGFLFSVILFATYFFLYPQYDIILFILAIQCVLSAILFDLFESVAFGLEKMEFSGIINLLSTLFWLISIMLIPESQLTLHIIFILFVFFSSLKTIVYFFIDNLHI